MNPSTSYVPVALDVLIVGSGFAGLCLAIQLQREGRRWKLIEQAPDLGGTWRDNHYPGAACDIPSNLYSFSFMPNPEWSRRFPPQAEILAYMRRCAVDGDVRSGMRFNTKVERARWSDAETCWNVDLSTGETLRSRTLALGTGGLSRPQMPEVQDLDKFRGVCFHSARWRHDVSLAGKRVGVIGTGASAIQIVPTIVPRCGSLTLFQRTAAWIAPRDDRPVPEQRKARYRRQPWRQALDRALTYARLEARVVGFTRAPWLLKLAQKQVVASLALQVPEDGLRARLTPDYTLGCKRVLLSDDFYPALLRPNVQLVNHAVVRATERGVVSADGTEHPLDVLIAATGFQVAGAGTPFEVIGRDGRSLNQQWGSSPQAYLGTTVAGFPNLFLMTGPNTGLGHNSMVYIIESQTKFVLRALDALDKKRVPAFDTCRATQEAFNHRLQARLARSVWNAGGCRSWYLASDGSNRVLWPDFTFKFRRLLSRFDWRDFEPILSRAS